MCSEPAISKPHEVEFRFTLALPFHLRLSDAGYEGNLGRNAYLLHTKSIYSPIGEDNTSPGKLAFKPFTGELTMATGAEVPGALLRYTLVCVQFWKKLSRSDLDENDCVKALAQAHRYLNHFLDIYRFLTQDTEVHPLTRREFHQVRAGRALHRSVHLKQGEKAQLQFGIIFDEDDPITLGPPVPLEDSVQVEFRRLLKSSVVPALPGLLLLNAESYLRSGEERLAVIDMNAALDIVMETVALSLLEAKGTPRNVARDMLEGMLTRRIILEIVDPGLALDIKSDPDWIAWDASCRMLRNRVIHDAYEPKAGEASESLRVIRALCAKVGMKYPEPSEER